MAANGEHILWRNCRKSDSKKYNKTSCWKQVNSCKTIEAINNNRPTVLRSRNGPNGKRENGLTSAYNRLSRCSVQFSSFRGKFCGVC